MKIKKLFFLGLLLFAATLCFSQEDLEKKLDSDSLRVLIKDELVKVLDSTKKEVIGSFIKSKLPITVYSINVSNREEKLNDSSNKKIENIREIINDKKIDDAEINNIVEGLLKKQLHNIDSLLKITAKNYSNSRLTYSQFNKSIQELNKKRDSLLNKKAEELKKLFFTSKLVEISKMIDEKETFVEEVGISINEGVISDIKVKLSNGNIYRTKTGVSLTRIRKYYTRKLYEISGNQTYIYLGDVFTYNAKPGLNYLPEEVVLTIKSNETEKELDISNDLKSFLDFRVYTDFLGLIDEDSNGIINFEASSKIYISPSPITFLSWEWHFFKYIKPYVSYSRFDNDNKYIDNSFDGINSIYNINNKLDLLQKSFIKTGAEFNVIQVKGQKEFPFSIYIPFRFQYNLAETEINNESVRLASQIYGTGLTAHLRRFDNFGLNIGISLDWITPTFNSSTVSDIDYFTTIGMDSEMFFYANKDKSSAIFLRFNTRRVYYEKDNFSMIQVGYKKDFSFSK